MATPVPSGSSSSSGRHRRFNSNLDNRGVPESSLGAGSSSDVNVDPSIAAARGETANPSPIDSRSSSKDQIPSYSNPKSGTDTNPPQAPSHSSYGSSQSSSPAFNSSSGQTDAGHSTASPRLGSTSVRPAEGVMHQLKKAFSSTTSHVGEDPVINESYEKLESNNSDLRRLRSSLNDYENLRRQFVSAFDQVCRDFVRCFQDPQHPYADLANQMLRIQQQQQSTLESNSISQLVNQVDQICNDSEQDQQQIHKQLDERNTKLSDVQYYASKVEKMKRDAPSNGGETKLDRNLAKYEQIQQEYNRENEQLVRGMNESWKNRSLSLGPILVQFLQRRGAFESQQQFAQFQQQLNNISGGEQQEKWRQHYWNSRNLVPTDAGIIQEIPTEQKEKEFQSQDIQKNQTDESNTRDSGSSLPKSKPNTDVTTSPSPTVAGSSSSSSSSHPSAPPPPPRDRGSVGVPPLVELITWEEQVGYHKETFLRERVHVRKSVAMEEVTLTVPIRKEKMEIEAETIEPSTAESFDSLNSNTIETAGGGESGGWKTKEEMGYDGSIGESAVGSGVNSLGSGSRVESGATRGGSSEWDRMKEDHGRNREDQMSRSRGEMDKESRDRDRDRDRGVKSDESPLSGPDDNQEVVMILHEERPRVVLDWVPVERVVVKKAKEKAVQVIQTEVRKEKVELDETGIKPFTNEPLIV